MEQKSYLSEGIKITNTLIDDIIFPSVQVGVITEGWQFEQIKIH